ncbi:MAG: hypothetical protein ACI9JZ_002817 [Lentimonas sp.]|jgi:hypothetical protein
MIKKKYPNNDADQQNGNNGTSGINPRRKAAVVNREKQLGSQPRKQPAKTPLNKSARDNRANQLNPKHEKTKG